MFLEITYLPVLHVDYWVSYIWVLYVQALEIDYATRPIVILHYRYNMQRSL
jgi:hypothetical protein